MLERLKSKKLYPIIFLTIIVYRLKNWRDVMFDRSKLRAKMKMSHDNVLMEKQFFKEKRVTINSEEDYDILHCQFHKEIKDYISGKITVVENIFDDEAIANLLNFRQLTLKFQERVNARSKTA